VLLEVLVHVLEHGGERGGLAAAGGAGQQHDAARRLGDVLEDGHQPEGFKVRHLALDVAHGQRPLAALLEYVRPETSDALHEIREVHLALLLQTRREVFWDDVS
jgi:hypothetical protein